MADREEDRSMLVGRHAWALNQSGASAEGSDRCSDTRTRGARIGPGETRRSGSSPPPTA